MSFSSKIKLIGAPVIFKMNTVRWQNIAYETNGSHMELFSRHYY